jgi:DNA-binding protein Alba
VRATEETKREDPPENTIYIGANPGIGGYINRVLGLFEERKITEVFLKASGNAITNAVRLSEMLRHGYADVYVQNELDNREVVTIFKSLEQGLDDIELSRHVTSVVITLALNPKEKTRF